MAKGIFQELVEAFKELEKEIEEAEKGLEGKKQTSQRKIQGPPSRRSANNKVDRKKFQAKDLSKADRPRAGEGESQTTDYMERSKTLRDRVSNLENRRSLIGNRDDSPRREGEEINSQALKTTESKEESRELILEDLSKEKTSISVTRSEVENEELKAIVRSLKSGDKLMNARRAFIYSSIFDRRF